MSYLVPAEEVVKSYVELRVRMIELLRSLPEEAASTRVPHCPDWTVQETVSHMVGTPESIMTGDMEGVPGEAWTQRQVERHRGHSLKDLADIWEAQGDAFVAVLSRIPQPVLSQVVFDVATHEQDVRCAVNMPGARDAASVAVGVGYIKTLVDSRDDLDVDVINSWSASEFDIFRSLAGRRSAEQIAASGADVAFIEKTLERLPTSSPAVSIPE
jgi:uncharacterized protein (TIGR03083 family)